MSLFSELKRRNVIRAAIAYGVFAWLLLQVVDFSLDIVGYPNWIMHTLVVLAALGLPCVMTFAWLFEITPDGIKRDADVPREQSVRAQTGQTLNRLTLVVVVVLVVFLVTNRNRNMLEDDGGEESNAPVAEEQVKDAIN
jgi:hypothetical protein